MAKKNITKDSTSAKQTAATRRTKKTVTPTKKAPTKKKQVETSKDEVIIPKSIKEKKKKVVKKNSKVIAPKKKVTTKEIKKSKVVKTTKRTVKSGKTPTIITTLAKLEKVKTENNSGAFLAIKYNTPNKKSNKKCFILPQTASSAEFSEMGEKVKQGLVKWSHYAIDGDIGYHYYEKLK